jgi:hypothetical protein
MAVKIENGVILPYDLVEHITNLLEAVEGNILDDNLVNMSPKYKSLMLAITDARKNLISLTIKNGMPASYIQNQMFESKQAKADVSLLKESPFLLLLTLLAAGREEKKTKAQEKIELKTLKSNPTYKPKTEMATEKNKVFTCPNCGGHEYEVADNNIKTCKYCQAMFEAKKRKGRMIKEAITRADLTATELEQFRTFIKTRFPDMPEEGVEEMIDKTIEKADEIQAEHPEIDVRTADPRTVLGEAKSSNCCNWCGKPMGKSVKAAYGADLQCCVGCKEKGLDKQPPTYGGKEKANIKEAEGKEKNKYPKDKFEQKIQDVFDAYENDDSEKAKKILIELSKVEEQDDILGCFPEQEFNWLEENNCLEVFEKKEKIEEALSQRFQDQEYWLTRREGREVNPDLVSAMYREIERLDAELDALKTIPCSECSGEGSVDTGIGILPCPSCHGEKKVAKFKEEIKESQQLNEGLTPEAGQVLYLLLIPIAIHAVYSMGKDAMKYISYNEFDSFPIEKKIRILEKILDELKNTYTPETYGEFIDYLYTTSKTNLTPIKKSIFKLITHFGDKEKLYETTISTIIDQLEGLYEEFNQTHRIGRPSNIIDTDYSINESQQLKEGFLGFKSKAEKEAENTNNIANNQAVEAIAKDNVAFMEDFLTKHDVNSFLGIKSYGPLTGAKFFEKYQLLDLAIWDRATKVALLLIDKGASLNNVSKLYGEHYILFAIKKGEPGVVKKMLDSGRLEITPELADDIYDYAFSQHYDKKYPNLFKKIEALVAEYDKEHLYESQQITEAKTPVITKQRQKLINRGGGYGRGYAIGVVGYAVDKNEHLLFDGSQVLTPDGKEGVLVNGKRNSKTKIWTANVKINETNETIPYNPNDLEITDYNPEDEANAPGRLVWVSNGVVEESQQINEGIVPPKPPVDDEEAFIKKYGRLDTAPYGVPEDETSSMMSEEEFENEVNAIADKHFKKNKEDKIFTCPSCASHEYNTVEGKKQCKYCQAMFEAKKKKTEKWMQDAVPEKNKGKLHKKLGIPEDETIPKSRIKEEIKKLEAKKEKSKDGKFSKEDLKFFRELQFALRAKNIKESQMQYTIIDGYNEKDIIEEGSYYYQKTKTPAKMPHKNLEEKYYLIDAPESEWGFVVRTENPKNDAIFEFNSSVELAKFINHTVFDDKDEPGALLIAKQLADEYFEHYGPVMYSYDDKQ